MARKNLLKGFKKPKGISFEHLQIEPNYGKFTASPYEPGFGTTIGNTLRRILLSSIQGYAITAVRIIAYDAEGVSHVISSEFDIILGIAEDTLEILSSLKRLRLKLVDDVEQDTVLYEFTGPCVVTSSDFERAGQVEVFTKDVPIFTMMDGAHVDFEFQIDLGRGYVPAEVNENYVEVVGTIPMDAIFTPVPKVKFSIDPCRVGQRNDYDKLILEIWTDGSISPDDAIAEAAKIAKDHFNAFINFGENEFFLGDEFEEIDESVRKILSTPVEELELSVRSSNCLKNANIRTIGELTRRTEDDIGKTRNFGKKSLDEIKQKLTEWGLGFGMTDYSHLKDKTFPPIERETKETPDES
jgi:DNA-directed RNA polymerase subunit alpha